jgi:hypothetical protein
MADGREIALPERKRNSVDKYRVLSWTEGHERYPHLLIPGGRYTEALNQNQLVGFSAQLQAFPTG